MPVRLIAEIGSTHGGRLGSCMSAIMCAAEAGISDVKFQLLEKEHLGYGNVPFDWAWIKEVAKYGRDNGMNVFFSCWTKMAMSECIKAGCDTVKIAYSSNKCELVNYALELFKEVFVSCDLMTPTLPGGCTKLYCIPEYPVKYRVDFEGIFPRFDGFSDHTLGVAQTEIAIRYGAKVIEKHVCQDPSVDCPDSRFAISWDKMAYLAERYCK